MVRILQTSHINELSCMPSCPTCSKTWMRAQPCSRATPYLHISGTHIKEWLLVQDLADAIEEGEVQKFTEVVYQFDSMTRLDPWKTTLLLRTKQNITAKEHEEDDLT
jgi:hypothetical protein